MRRKNAVIRVLCDIPYGADPAEVAGFVADALETWGGQMDPETEPLFNSLSVKEVRIGRTSYANPKPKDL